MNVKSIKLCPLHAAAPDLLFTLQRIAVRAENDKQFWIADEAYIAIAKARGEVAS